MKKKITKKEIQNGYAIRKVAELNSFFDELTKIIKSENL